MNGKLVKLKIVAFKDAEFQSESGREYETLINPENYSEDIRLAYSEAQELGASAAQLKYKGTQPPDVAFTFLFDGTGVLPEASGNVVSQIEAFKKVVLNFEGDIHQPFYLKIIWGAFLFKGRLTGLNINYILFSPDGIPLRAKADAQFRGSTEVISRKRRERTSSPDLTHVRTVKEGDTLPLLSQEVYGDPSHYLELARFNRFTNFRKLTPGNRIIFPPLAR